MHPSHPAAYFHGVIVIMNNTLSPIYEEDLLKEIETLRRQLKNVRSAKGRFSWNEPYHAILEDLPDLLCLFTPDGTISYANASFCKYFCKNRHEPVGNSVFSYIPRKDRKRFARSIEKLTAKKPMSGFEYSLKGIAGETRWHQWSLKALFKPSGTSMEYLLAGSDITRLKTMEEDLIDALEKYATLFECTKDAIVIHDAERFLDCNRAALTLFRLDDKEVFLHRSFLDFSLPGSPGRRKQALELARHFESASRNGMERFQILCRRSDCSHFHADILLSPFPLGTRNVFSSVIRDITDFIAAEDTLKRTCSELQNTARARSTELRRMDRKLALEIQKRKNVEHHLKVSEENFRKVSGEIKAMRRKTS
jgi:PAS domain S-box-containing protein